jgi:HNH endonuclease
MSRYHKTRARKRGRRIRDIFILTLALFAALVLFALDYWQLFLWCAEGAGGLIILYLLYKIAKWMERRETAEEQQGAPMRDSRYISPELRQAVWTRDGGRCIQCQSESLLEYDHIIPLSKGGATSYGNLQILCRTCNRHKSDRI